jgi:hypothetical protein
MLFPQTHAWTPRQRCLIVAGVVVAGLVTFSALVYSYQRYHRAELMRGVEHIEDLGFGFRRVTIARFNKFEMGHYPFLYYRNRLLCQIGGPPSISPSGNFAIYQDGRSGKLILFRRRDEKVSQLTSTFVELAYPFVWHEDEGTVEVELAKEHMSLVFPLQ